VYARTVWGRGEGREENCTLLGYYATSGDNFLPTFRGNLSVQSSGVKYQRFLLAEDGTETSRNIPKERCSDLLRGGT
jgi:hypothetical protein